MPVISENKMNSCQEKVRFMTVTEQFAYVR